MQTLAIAEDSNADLRQKLKAEEQARKSFDLALKSAETQAESQRKLANEVKDLAEKAKLQAEEDKVKAEKEKDEAEQHGYDVGVAETEDTFRAEVPAVCCAYCGQTWEEALNQARVEASSELRRPERIIFPSALQIPKQNEIVPLAPQLIIEAPTQHPHSTDQPEQGKEKEIQKGPFSDKMTKAPQPGTAS